MCSNLPPTTGSFLSLSWTNLLGTFFFFLVYSIIVVNSPSSHLQKSRGSLLRNGIISVPHATISAGQENKMD